MLDKRTIVVYLIAGAAIVSSAWITFVPESVAGSTLGSILAVAFGLLVVSTIALRSSRATPSVAQWSTKRNIRRRSPHSAAFAAATRQTRHDALPQVRGLAGGMS
jgi:membrane protein YqaA with SNARE-associated domain